MDLPPWVLIPVEASASAVELLEGEVGMGNQAGVFNRRLSFFLFLMAISDEPSRPRVTEDRQAN